MLLAEVEELEVKNALFSMKGLKAPGKARYIAKHRAGS